MEVPETETDEEFVDLLQNARRVGPGIAERIAPEFDSMEEFAEADGEEIEAFDHIGPTARMHIQNEILVDSSLFIYMLRGRDEMFLNIININFSK